MALLTTSADGTFQVPAIAEGTAYVWPSVARNEPYLPRFPRDLSVHARQTTRLTLRLEHGIPLIGKVRTEKEGKPVENAVLFLRNRLFLRDQYAVTNSQGLYSAFVLPGEKVDVTLLRVPEAYIRRQAVIHKLTVPPDCERFEVPDFTAVAAVQIHGKVVDERGDPVAGARVIATDVPRSVVLEPTRKNGEFSLLIPQEERDRLSYSFLVTDPRGFLDRAKVVRRGPLTLQVAFDRLAIQGVWNVASLTESGKKRSQTELKANQLVFTADRLLVWDAKSLVARYAYKIDATREPGQIVLVRNEGSRGGIYRLQGDALTLCISKDGKKPTHFTSKPGSGAELWVLKSDSTTLSVLDAESSRLARALLDQTEAEFIDTPLRDAIGYFSQLHNIPIVIDSNALKLKGIDEDVPISLIISGVRLASVLRIMLRPLGLTYELRGKQIVITTAS